MGKKGTVLNQVAQFLGPLLKRRPARTRARRICLEDPELLQTELLPATPYKAVIDPVKHQVIILPADEDDGTLPHVARTKGKACIDLRAKHVLDAFETVREGEEEVLYVQVSLHQRGVILHQDEMVEAGLLVVEGFAPDTGEGAQERLAEAQREAARKGRITDIRQFMAVKRVVRAQMRMDEFREILAATGTCGGPTGEYGSAEAISGLFGSSTVLHQPVFRLDTPVMQEFQAKVRAALQAASLFSGAGLLDIGATLAGLEVVFALEVDADACETYRHNFGNHIVCADVRRFDLSKIPKVPIMFGGPPCKGFSTLNNKRSPEYHTNDLIDYFIEAVRLNTNCQVFVVENVPGFLAMDGGSFLERLKRGLKDFAITAGVLRALDYGSPQDRTRAIVIGARRDGIGEIPLPKPTLMPGQYRTVRWALQGYHKGLPNARDYSQSSELTKARIRAIKPGQNWRALPEHLREGLNEKTFFHKYYRLLPDAPSITLGNLNKSHVIGPYDEDHFLDVRQGARLFGVPDKFVFKGGLKARMEQVGNGVCVHLGYHLFRHIREYIERYVMWTELGFQP